MFGKKDRKKDEALCIMLGEDRKLSLEKLEATGVTLIHNDNRLAFNSLPEAIGVFTRILRGGVKRQVGQVSVLFEPMARPYSFKDLDWAKVSHKEEVILATARSEGAAKAVQSMEKEDRFDKMATILLLLSAGVIGMALLFALQSGIFSKLTGG